MINTSKRDTLYVLLIFLIILSCNSSNKHGKKDSSSTVKESTSKDGTPESWPWRGISISSAHAESKDINFKFLKAVHVNHVSLAYMPAAHARNYKLNWRETISSDIDWLHQMLDSCVKYEINAAITYQEFPHDPAANYSQSSSKFWNDRTLLDSAMNIVRGIVTEFQNRGNELVAFEFFCEPVIKDLPGPAIRPPIWREFAQDIINEVRKIDTQRYIIINTGPWGNPNGYADWSVLNGEKIIYGTHMYQPNNYTSHRHPDQGKDMMYPGKIKNRNWNKEDLRQVFQYVRKFQLENNALIYVGEFSAAPWAVGSEQYIQECTEVFDEYNFSYSYWNLNGWPIWNIHYDKGFPNNKKGVGHAGYESSKWKALRKAFLKNAQ
ncbi:MAG: cellulase family glycosylhydrolase [Bacteroidia bacterium]|nr:cellulase family glycosylhydrolase [Bacteroidia bacterium]